MFDFLRRKQKQVAKQHHAGQVYGFVTITLRKKLPDNPNYFAVTRGTNFKIYLPQYKDIEIVKNVPNLLTNSGRDWMHAQVYTNTAAGTRGSGFLAVTEDTAAAAAGDTTLAAEITTNGLARADAVTKSHTVSTNSTTIEHTHTATGSFTDVVKSALFNASSSGQMTHEAKYTTGSGTMISGDTLKTTWTLNLG